MVSTPGAHGPPQLHTWVLLELIPHDHSLSFSPESHRYPWSVTRPPCPVCLLPADLRNKWHLVIDRLTVLFLKFLECFHKLQVFLWWILELHIIKIVSSYIIWVSVKEASERWEGHVQWPQGLSSATLGIRL